MPNREREQPKEIVESIQPRSANYVARILDQSPQAFDFSKPFITSADRLSVTPEGMKTIDKLSADDSNKYWEKRRQDGIVDYDSQMRTFCETWANAIKSDYAFDEAKIDAMEAKERRQFLASTVVLMRLGLSSDGINPERVQSFYDKYFKNGRNTHQFISDVRKLFSREDIRQNIDTIRYVAEMFDTETAADIAGILLAEAQDDKNVFVEKANIQAKVTNINERRRLARLANYRSSVHLEEKAPEIKIVEDSPEIKIITSKDQIDEMAERIKVRRGGEGDKDVEVEINDTQPRIDESGAKGSYAKDLIEQMHERIRVERETDEGIESREFPAGAQLKGETGDGLSIVINPKLLKKIDADIVDRSVNDKGEHTMEAAGFILGRRYRDPKTGRLWTEVADYVSSPGLSASAGSVTFSPESFRRVNDFVQNTIIDQEVDNLGIIGYVHSHPIGAMGMMSETDAALNELFSGNGQFALVLGVGSDVDDLSAELDLSRLHAFFSRNGGGEESTGGYKKHKGIYFTSQDTKGLPDEARIRLIGQIVKAPIEAELDEIVPQTVK